MPHRANWKGFLKIAELNCPVALYTAVSTSERIAFHTINRKTGHRVKRQFIDQETGKPVESADQVKGYETARGAYVVLEPEEIEATVPGSDKTLEVKSFIPCSDIDDVYFDRPYYLTPGDPVAQNTFALIREGMRANKVAALARTVLFRRVRTLLIRPHGEGLIGTTLNFEYEVRAADEAFESIPSIKIEGEMLDLARHIIQTKQGKFDLGAFDDRYESALADLVRSKLEGKPLPVRKTTEKGNVIDLMDALRRSAAGMTRAKPAAAKAAGKKKKTAADHARNRKAG